MPDKKQNPLIGAFRDPAPGVPPGTPASGEKKPFEPVQIAMEVAPAGAIKTGGRSFPCCFSFSVPLSALPLRLR